MTFDNTDTSKLLSCNGDITSLTVAYTCNATLKYMLNTETV
jgi:hypothetical protein